MRRGHLWRLSSPRARPSALPAIEPAPRGRSVDPDRRGLPVTLPPVLPRIQEHIRECMPYLARGLQRVQMVSTVKNRPPAPVDPVHGSREPSRDRLHAPPQGLLSSRFDDQVSMRPLERVVHHSKLPALARIPERPSELPDEPAFSQRGHATPDAKRDVTRVVSSNRLPPDVVYRRVRHRRPSGS